MADLPPMTYGRVKGRLVAGVADSLDSGEAPDALPLKGTVTFTLSASELKVTGATPDPTTVYPQSITVALDSSGYLSQNASRLIPLLATNDPSTNPTDLQWTISYDVYTQDGKWVERAPWNFALPAGTIVDITIAAPLLEPAPNTIIIKGDKGDPADETTKEALGLGNVDNTSDEDKPVSTAQAEAISARLAKSANLNDVADKAAARANLGVPAVGDVATAAQGVKADAAIPSTLMGAALGVATLDDGSKILISQIPNLPYTSPGDVEIIRTGLVDRIAAGGILARPAEFTGIDPSGGALSTVGLRLALVAAITAKVDLFIPGGVYRLNGSLTNLVEGAAGSIRVFASENARFIQTTNNFAVDMYASVGVIYNVASVTEAQGNTSELGGDSDTLNMLTITLPAGSTPGYALGDRVKLVSDDVMPQSRPTDDGVTARRMGADFEVFSCVGNVVKIAATLEPFTADAGSFATNPRLFRLSDEVVEWHGGQFEMDSLANVPSRTVGHIRMTGLTDCVVTDIKAPSAAGQVVQFRGCLRPRADSIDVGYAANNPGTGSLGYAVLDSSSSYGLYTNLSARVARHAYTDDSNPIPVNVTDIANLCHYGFTWSPTVSGVRAVGTVSEAISPHAHSRGGDFSGLKAVGCAGGFGARGARHTFRDSVIEACDTGIAEFTENGRSTMCAGMVYSNIRMRKIRQAAIRLNKNYNGPNVGERVTEATKFIDVIVEDAKAGAVLIVNSSIALFGSGIQIYANQPLADGQSFVDIDSSTVRGPGEIGLNVYGINSGSNLILVKTLKSTSTNPGSWRGPSIRLYGSTSQTNRFGYVVSGLSDFQFEGCVYLENVISRARFIASRGTGTLLEYKVGGGSGESSAYFPVPDAFITDATQDAWLATLDAPVVTLAINFLNLDTDGTTPKYLHKMGAPNRAGQIRHLLNAGAVNGRVGHGSSAYGTNLKLNGTTPAYRELVPNEQISVRWVNGAWKQFA